MNAVGSCSTKILLAVSAPADSLRIVNLLREINSPRREIECANRFADVLSARAARRDYDLCLIERDLASADDWRAFAALDGAPAILLLDNEAAAFDAEVAEIGAAAFLVKNKLDAQQLNRTLDAVLNRSRAVAERADKYRNLIEKLPVMCYAAEPRPPYAPIYISPEFARFGYPIEEWLSNVDFWIKVLHPEDRDRVLRDTAAAIVAGRETDLKYRIVTRDNSVRWIHDCGRFVRSERGEVLCWQGVMLDITEHKRADEDLRRSEQRYREMFEKNRAIKLLIDPETGAIIDANPAACDFYGYSLAEFQTKRITDLNTLPAAEVEREIKRAATEQRKYFVFQHRLASGAVRAVEVHSSPLTRDGKPLLYSIIADVTERVTAAAALEQSEQRYRDLFENANDLIYTHDLAGNFTSLNRAGEVITGYARAEALTMNIAEVLAPEYLEVARRMIARKTGGDAPTTYEVEIVTKNQRRVTLELSTRLIRESGKAIGVQGVGRDITARKQAEKSLIESERRYRFLSEGIMHQVWTAQPDGKINYVNRRALEYFGKTSAEMLADGWRSIIHPDDLPICLERWQHSLETGADYNVEFRLRRHDNAYRWHLARATAARDADGRIVNWYGTSTDIDDKKTAEAKLSHLAQHDALTNLPNRAAFMDYLARRIRRAEKNANHRFAVLFLDLDRFKIINDGLGHIVGDKLLVSIAERLKTCIRPGDIAARLGGDEFTILLGSVESERDAIVIAERVQRELNQPFWLDGYEVFTSASIGVIVSDEIVRQPEDFLRDADTAMYRAKERGKARCEIFDREMRVRNLTLLQVENDLRRAVEREEFRVYYQPIVSLETAQIREFEALVRWQHHEFGLVAPNQFIGVAEETGLIALIGEWVLREACRQTAQWQRQAVPRLAVSVNLSAKQLMNPALPEQIKAILRETELDARFLKLEVTESMVMEQSERALDVLNELRRLGASLSTDDFGTGYSSLSYLHRFPFERLKIDRSFVNKMDSDQKSLEIVRTILLLAKTLNLEVVAEGIENERQLNLLRKLGCKLGQGFLFAKPVAAPEAAKLLREGVGRFAAKPEFPLFDNKLACQTPV